VNRGCFRSSALQCATLRNGFVRIMSPQLQIYRSLRLEEAAMDVTVAISTERDEVFVCVVTQPASRANVVHLETIGGPAVLASPAVALQHFGTEFAIRLWVQSKSRLSRLEITHCTFPIC
jgi:hypothetical protein